MPVSVFLSYCSDDGAFAKELANIVGDVIRCDVRCSDVDGLRPPAGVPYQPLLATEIAEAPVFLAVMSSHAAQAEWVLIEVGARWCADLVLHSASPHDERLSCCVLLHGFPPGEVPEVMRGRQAVDGRSADAIEDLLGRIALVLGARGPLYLLKHRGRIRDLAAMRPARGGRRTRSPLAWLALALLTIVLIVFALGSKRYQGASTPKYDFEQTSAGWGVGSDARARGCTGVRRAQGMGRTGNHSLQLDLKLNGDDDTQRKGEAWVDLVKNGPAGVSAPVDLKGQLVRAWVKAPAPGLGEEKIPNGFQLFVKDRNWVSHYGPWVNVEPNTWQELSFEVGALEEGSRPDVGFDPANVAVLGVKMEVGTGSHAQFDGHVHVDSINW